MIRSPAGFDGGDRIKRYLDYYQPSYGVMMLSAGQAFSPASLFAAGEQGVWYDPSDFSTMFQDAAGTTPVTAVEQPVGLLLDKSQGLVLGPELVTNGNFSSATGWTITSGWSIGGGVATATASSGYLYQIIASVVANKYYDCTVTITSYTSGTLRFFAGASAATSAAMTAAGTYTLRVCANSANQLGVVGTTFTGVIDNISIKEVKGNHATQSTNGAQPTLSARVNLLTFSEQFDNAAWNKLNASITATNGIAPNGTATADTLTENTATSGHGFAQSFTTAASTAYTFSFYAKANGRSTIDVVALTGFTVNPTVRFTLSGSGASATRQGNPTPTHSIENVGSGWYLCRINVTTVAGGSTTFGANLVSDVAGSSFYAGDGVSGAFFWGADLRPANTGVGLPVYQRIAAATDYDTTGFPLYLKFDGTDDSMATGTITPGIDKVQVFAGVQKRSDTGFGGIVELSAEVASNNGSFLIRGPESGANYFVGSKGTSTVLRTLTTYTAPITNTITLISNISGPLLQTRINGSIVDTSTTTQGTGNFLAYPLYIGSRGGTQLRFPGNIYSLIVRFGSNLDATTISNTETYVNGKTLAY